MSDERNPERDWSIIRSRQDVRDAEEELARRPSPFNALDLQDKRKRWVQASRLTLVKKV